MICKAKVSGDIKTARSIVGGEICSTQLALAGGISISQGSPPYEGEYEFTPTQSTQVVEIANHLALSDIIINPIPSNYGLITWDGSVLTVS